jgi:hypothetical protein
MPGMTLSAKNARTIDSFLAFLAIVFQQRLESSFNPDRVEPDLSGVMKIVLASDDSEISKFIREHRLTSEEILVLLMALAPHVRPAFFDTVIQQQLPQSGDFPQIGGVRGKQFRGFLPSGETALFLLAGDDLQKRFEYSRFFYPGHFFSDKGLLWLDRPEPGEPPLSGKLVMGQDYLELFIQGKISRPKMSMDFPAEFITTELTEEDLVLPAGTQAQIRELENWIMHQDALMKKWNMKRWVKPGYRALFHGPPGTGKTLSALILGRKTGRDVFRIDLSMVISKYIGETEKNLSQLFDRANDKEWILFFDEADALFGKRTNVRDAHDKYANQEVSYLLQRIENHNGLVILASNLKSNIDEAFTRRFQSVVYFPPPSPQERLLLWEKILPRHKDVQMPSGNELLALSKKYEITGAGIVNVVQYCCLEALAGQSHQITVEQLQKGIEREYMKEGKVF